jgi:hypothetical protein
MTMHDPATGTPTGVPVDETGYDPAAHRPGADKGHETCRFLALDLDHDEDARAAARFYAARVSVKRPILARDLLAVPGVDDLRPGERYVDPEEVDLDAVRRRG